jgi:aspartyl-tRNA(Asn)/glutamyl-tRNA(Gln) amidotransferase subunit B
LPLELTQKFVDDLATHLPELPDAKRARFIKEYGLSVYDANVLVAEKERADYFEDQIARAKGKAEPKAIANWVINEFLGRINKEGLTLETSKITPAANMAIVCMIADGTISGKIAKDVFDIAWTTGRDPIEIVGTEGMKQVTDTGAIEKAVDEIIAANPEKVEQAKAKPSMLGWFVGQVMKASGGKANPAAVNEILKKKLGI